MFCIHVKHGSEHTPKILLLTCKNEQKKCKKKSACDLYTRKPHRAYRHLIARLEQCDTRFCIGVVMHSTKHARDQGCHQINGANSPLITKLVRSGPETGTVCRVEER